MCRTQGCHSHTTVSHAGTACKSRRRRVAMLIWSTYALLAVQLAQLQQQQQQQQRSNWDSGARVFLLSAYYHHPLRSLFVASRGSPASNTSTTTSSMLHESGLIRYYCASLTRRHTARLSAASFLTPKRIYATLLHSRTTSLIKNTKTHSTK